LGRIEQALTDLIQGLYGKFGEKNIRSVSFTGNHGKKLSEFFGTYYEFETISQVLGAIHIKPDVRTIISMGGQDTALMQINHYDAYWELEYFNTNGPCASGTGSFIDQQAQRLATSMYSQSTDTTHEEIDEILKNFVRLGLRSQKAANVACRCTVFTKSDMIHLQNKGERLEDIIAGLHVGNARNYMSTIVSNRILEKPAIFIGGMCLNELQVRALQDYIEDLFVPPYATSIGALGVALQALDLKDTRKAKISLLKYSSSKSMVAVPFASELRLNQTHFSETNAILSKPLHHKTRVYLGIDIGSTTTKYAVIDEQRRIVHKCYVPTRGKPIEVTQNILRNLREDQGKYIDIVGTATTGSGRNVVGEFLNADLIIDEITAHARGAVEIEPNVDTIFEIGGQDSKYVYIANTHPLDFDMNKVCAAGTGSFLHELANKYGINIVGEFQDIALSSKKPVKLAERCTVFMESDLVSYHQKGVAQNDLIAGLCYAIVHNYLNRVVEKRKIGQRIMFLGGPSLNKGVVAAFENVLGRGLLLPLHREVLGAFGAAVSVQEKMEREGTMTTTFRGLDRAIADRMSFSEKTCRVDPHCHNQCKLKIYNFDGRRSIWGGECGRYELSKTLQVKKENYFRLREQILETHLEGVCEDLKDAPIMEADGRPTVGMQRSLYGHHNCVLWAHFFDQLGFRLVWTPPTNARISEAGIEKMAAETCYPIKVSHGHIRELIGKTRYLFLPSLITMATPKPEETGFYCPLVQSNSYMVRMAFGLDPSNLLAPVIHLKYDTGTLALEISEQIGAKIGAGRKAIRHAISYGLERQQKFIEDLHAQGKRILEDLDPEEPLILVTGRPYNLYDERLNLRLGRNLARIGVQALPMDFIDVSEVDLSDFPSMYWGLGAQILRTAKLVKEHTNYFGLHLTNFGCGADSFLEHFYRYIMGEKAYLILELDEHSGVAGVMTRLEAYRNVIENTMRKSPVSIQVGLRLAN
jgi:predicted CoA-substrate-specific enzyme activase